jgi:hypothetical protein
MPPKRRSERIHPERHGPIVEATEATMNTVARTLHERILSPLGSYSGPACTSAGKHVPLISTSTLVPGAAYSLGT